MALIKCPECGKDISNQAKACPVCGCPVTGSSIVGEISKNEEIDENNDKTGIIENDGIQPKCKKSVKWVIAILGLIAAVAAVYVLCLPGKTEHYDYAGNVSASTGIYVSKEMSEAFGHDTGNPWIEINKKAKTANICIDGIELGEREYSLGEDNMYIYGSFTFTIEDNQVILYLDGNEYYFDKQQE